MAGLSPAAVGMTELQEGRRPAVLPQISVNEEGLRMAEEEMMAKEEKFCCAATANSDAGKTMSGSSCCDCEKMVEEDRYCIDILIQVSAIQSALNAFNKELLAQHIHGCVVDDIRHGKDEVVDELVAAVQKLMK